MMRFLVGLMLATTVALPTVATAQQTDDRPQQGSWHRDRGDRQQQPRQQQAQPQPNAQQQPRQADGGAQHGQFDRAQSGEARQNGDWQRSQDARGQGYDGRQQQADRGRPDGGRGYDARADGRNGRGYSADRFRQQQRSFADRRDDYRAGNDFAERAQWNRGWRGNERYDYRDYRSANRGAFHLPRYYAPRGWDQGYRRYSVGIRLSPLLFGENYWLDDADDYRLPPAYGPYRWVRYYNDALLVDVRSGDVVDTVYDIFW